MRKYKVKFNYEDSNRNYSTIVHARSHDSAMEKVEENNPNPENKIYITEVQLIRK